MASANPAPSNSWLLYSPNAIRCYPRHTPIKTLLAALAPTGEPTSWWDRYPSGTLTSKNVRSLHSDSEPRLRYCTANKGRSWACFFSSARLLFLPIFSLERFMLNPDRWPMADGLEIAYTRGCPSRLLGFPHQKQYYDSSTLRYLSHCARMRHLNQFRLLSIKYKKSLNKRQTFHYNRMLHHHRTIAIGALWPGKSVDFLRW